MSRPRWLTSYIEFYCCILELNDAVAVCANGGYAGRQVLTTGRQILYLSPESLCLYFIDPDLPCILWSRQTICV